MKRVKRALVLSAAAHLAVVIGLKVLPVSTASRLPNSPHEAISISSVDFEVSAAPAIEAPAERETHRPTNGEEHRAHAAANVGAAQVAQTEARTAWEGREPRRVAGVAGQSGVQRAEAGASPELTQRADGRSSGETHAETHVGATGSAQPPRLNGMELLRASRDDARALAWGGRIEFADAGVARPGRSLVNTQEGTVEERARRASVGYIAERLAEGHFHAPPGVREYFWNLRRRIIESWRPGVSRTPTMADALLAGVMMPVAGQMEAASRAMGAGLHPGRVGSANDALDERAAGGSNDPSRRLQRPMVGIVELSESNQRTTTAEVEVDQDSTGRVIRVRVVHPSRVAGFDRAAVEAVRAAIPLQESVPMPGGRRSRWSFAVVASRDPIVPMVGMAFDESSGWFELHWPGRLHVRSRVWMEREGPLPPSS